MFTFPSRIRVYSGWFVLKSFPPEEMTHPSWVMVSSANVGVILTVSKISLTEYLSPSLFWHEILWGLMRLLAHIIHSVSNLLELSKCLFTPLKTAMKCVHLCQNKRSIMFIEAETTKLSAKRQYFMYMGAG